MKLSDMPTPETDACAKRCRDNLPFALASQNPIGSIGDVVTVAHARMLEQRLALAVAALESVAVDSQERFIRNVARAALAQIEEGK
jgi:pyridoxal biosynthesis lyase PdxS